ncbi:ABC transporter substrate-binding protein [Erysipelothrix urinaevulpis]|uniref:taurine ABC transporter substrate-binding protein n=1 Tax=Erysipelothrix urinaevulpis TaxID=2683717 RepID=UPI00135A5C13|nr:ABC transporter substrate-binding protein [Erysipelothrix urinaevulpis]
MKKKLIVMLVLSFILTACGGKTEDANNKVRIGIIRVPNDKTVAISMNYFKEYFNDKGFETEFIFFDSGVAANQAFSSGSIDFAEMGHTNGVVALANNLPVKLIWIHEVLGSNEALVVKEGSNIQSIKDLEGKKIATTFSSTSHLSLLKALEKEGIDKKVELLDMQTAEIVAAWERGDIQAAYSWEPGLSKLKESGSVLIDSEMLANDGIVTANIDLVHTNFIEKHPELVVDYIKTLDKAVSLYKNKPAKAIDGASKQLGLSVEDTKTQMQGTVWLNADQQLSKDYLGTSKQPGHFHTVFYQTGEFLKAQGNISEIPTMEAIHEFIDSSFIEKALGQ